jgi:alanine racemase
MRISMTPFVSAAIDTAALCHNLDAVRRRAPGASVMAVIKANAYGHGLVTVARALEKADAFAVARVDEGMALRAAGITKPVVLLEGVFERDQLETAAACGFELVVHIDEQVGLLRDAAPGMCFDVWLKLDTGMNRLGLKGPAFAAAHAALAQMPSVRQPVRLFSHFASADDKADPATALQLARFVAATSGLTGLRSLANSAAMLNFPESQADWVRPGLLLYGVSPLPGTVGADFGLRPVMTLHSRIIGLKDVAAGERVGYGGAWTAERRTRLAIAAVGYGDGYPRSVPSGSPVLVDGVGARIAGRVSMDMIGIDVTDLPRAAQLGDPVVLWGPGLPVERIAALAGAIPYELLCGISQRVAVSSRRNPS